jgi:hypothetical protein
MKQKGRDACPHASISDSPHNEKNLMGYEVPSDMDL